MSPDEPDALLWAAEGVRQRAVYLEQQRHHNARRRQPAEPEEIPHRCPNDGTWLLPGAICTTCAAIALYRRERAS